MDEGFRVLRSGDILHLSDFEEEEGFFFVVGVNYGLLLVIDWEQRRFEVDI